MIGKTSAEIELGDRDRLGRVLAFSHRYDPQTGFLNYPPFQEALASLTRSQGAEQEFVLLWIEIRNLRQEYLLRGPEGDDTLVRHVSACLRAHISADTLLGRFEGNVFLAAMPAAKFSTADRFRIQEVVDALRPATFSIGAARPEIAAGSAFYPSDTTSAAELIRFAGLAAARAASISISAVIPFHFEMNDAMLREYQMELEMNKGLDDDQFSTVYQPKIDLKTGRVLGAEALTSWQHPEWGQVSPDEFIPVAERSQIIHRIFERCLRSALENARRWRDQGLDVPVIAVNVAASDVRRAEFVRNVRQLLSENPIAPTELELEVTESMLLDDEDLFDVRLRQLRGAGVRIAIDDFGTRYTSFNMLRHLPFNSLKIDRCFIHGIQTSENLRTLCQTIVVMGRSLNLHTVAEGIEKPEELELLRQMGCKSGQGFLFSRPVPAEEFTAFLREWPAHTESFGFVQPQRMRTFFGT